MTDWFTGDMHFGHKNILKYCPRPWDDVDAMDEGLIERWNTMVQPGDAVYILGDVAFCGPDKATRLVQRLNGKLYLIVGNHDERNLKSEMFRSCFLWIEQLKEIRVRDETAHHGWQAIVLCHYAMRVWNRSHYGVPQVHGHSHATLPPLGRSLDVGVDAWNWFPASYAEVKHRFERCEVYAPDMNHQPKAEGGSGE